MTAHERRQLILALLRDRSGIRVSELAEVFDVSEGTIRNDLNALEQQGYLNRVHGGAVLTSLEEYPPMNFSSRHQANVEKKACIGAQAARLVNDGDSIFLDASSTAYYLALNLGDHERLRVITNGIEVARLMAHNASNTVILIGGVVNHDGSSVGGLLSEQIIADFHVKKAFVSCSGFTLSRGMTEVYFEETQLKRKAIESSQQVIALIDSSKMGHEDLTPFAHSLQISHIFTDPEISDEWIQRLQDAKIPFTICGSSAISEKDEGGNS
ncbi:MAG: DeoR/GlpR family DNA-binding transcription regulator [Anaerolineae bacterium]|nr:DeoR/GlpR family DNA-binding transcription regulator [Anaerolineae bacterium]